MKPPVAHGQIWKNKEGKIFLIIQHDGNFYWTYGDAPLYRLSSNGVDHDKYIFVANIKDIFTKVDKNAL